IIYHFLSSCAESSPRLATPVIHGLSAFLSPHNHHAETITSPQYQNAGVRAYDISNPYRPVETGALVPAAPEKMMDTRPNRPQVIQSCDVFVDAQGIIYSTDYNGGMSVIEYLG
ncbi:hypothetical protein QUG29_16545, partial [Enterobacter hormaechei]|nr:hypothetical protein [Enterobacter hormaechei]